MNEEMSAPSDTSSSSLSLSTVSIAATVPNRRPSEYDHTQSERLSQSRRNPQIPRTITCRWERYRIKTLVPFEPFKNVFELTKEL